MTEERDLYMNIYAINHLIVIIARVQGSNALDHDIFHYARDHDPVPELLYHRTAVPDD